jgi:hypothetical protein
MKRPEPWYGRCADVAALADPIRELTFDDWLLLFPKHSLRNCP